MTNANEITLEKEENKMGVMPIPKLLITMSLPMMISMLIQALYNIVDSMFVATRSFQEIWVKKILPVLTEQQKTESFLPS